MTKLPQTFPRQSNLFDKYTNSEIRRAAQTGIYDIRGNRAKSFEFCNKSIDFAKKINSDIFILKATMQRAGLFKGALSLIFIG